MLQYFNYIAVFLAGATATALAPHVAHILVGLTYPDRRGDTVIGIAASFPYNLIALVLLFASLAFIIWFSKKKVNQDGDLRKDIRELIQEIRQDRAERNNKPDTKL